MVWVDAALLFLFPVNEMSGEESERATFASG
jgi:hypothetical protein